MDRLVVSVGGVMALVAGLVTAQVASPADLMAMADTERAFAKRATVVGWRDAFLEFFADEAITFAPDVVPAKDGLRKQPSRPFSELELCGNRGWATLPRAGISAGSPGPAPPSTTQ